MAKIHGRTPLPLPDSVQLALTNFGFVQMAGEEPRPWRHPAMPHFTVRLVRTNMPGEQDVVMSLNAGAPQRVSPDVAVAMLMLLLPVGWT